MAEVAELGDGSEAGTRAEFQRRYGRAPRWLAEAPGRVNLIGEHTDYNQGLVLPLAIERRTFFAAAPGEPGVCRLQSTAFPGEVRISLRDQLEPGEPAWANYVRGVIAGFREAGAIPTGFDALLDSDIPMGTGLASSAAVGVVVATMLEAMIGEAFDPSAKARLCLEAEREFAGVPCGIMDQMSAICARPNHLMLLDCRSNEVQWVGFDDPKVALLVINTRVRHALADGAYGQRRAECEAAARGLGVANLRNVTLAELAMASPPLDEILRQRVRHVITENERVRETVRQIQQRQWSVVGELLFASHLSLRNDFEVSCPELDLVVEAARNLGVAQGVYGCRMTGGGFGGCAVALVRPEEIERVGRYISTDFRKVFGSEPQCFATRPVRGARMIEMPPL